MTYIPTINTGCPVEIRWRILTNGGAKPLERERLALMLRHECGDVWLDFRVEENIVVAPIPGNLLKWRGNYTLTIFQDKGKSTQLRVDYPHAFRVQNHSCAAIQNNFVDDMILRIGEDGLFSPATSVDKCDHEIATPDEVYNAVSSIFSNLIPPDEMPSIPDNSEIANADEVSEAVKNIFNPITPRNERER